jgi:hypothetical protein
MAGLSRWWFKPKWNRTCVLKTQSTPKNHEFFFIRGYKLKRTWNISVPSRNLCSRIKSPNWFQLISPNIIPSPTFHRCISQFFHHLPLNNDYHRTRRVMNKVLPPMWGEISKSRSNLLFQITKAPPKLNFPFQMCVERFKGPRHVWMKSISLDRVKVLLWTHPSLR